MKTLITLLILTISIKYLYPQVTLTGTAYHSPKQKVWLTNFFGKKYDSAVIDPKVPTFILKAPIQQESLLTIRYEKKSPYERNYFVVLPGEQVTFSFDATNEDTYQWIKVSGSPFTLERITELKKEQPYQRKIEDINKKLDLLDQQKSADTSRISYLTAQIDSNERQIVSFQQRLLDTTKSVTNAIFAYTKVKNGMQGDLNGRDSLLIILKGRFPGNIYIQAQNSLTDADMQVIHVNTKAPDIILKDVNGFEVDAGKIDYKYLLIDFWASWCKPCREQTPYLLKTYNAFKYKGFKILSLSIDADIGKWKKAIIEDGTSAFIHVYDPAAAKSVYMDLFKVRYIPVNFLIDKNGVIVAENLRGDDLIKRISMLISGN